MSPHREPCEVTQEEAPRQPEEIVDIAFRNVFNWLSGAKERWPGDTGDDE